MSSEFLTRLFLVFGLAICFSFSSFAQSSFDHTHKTWDEILKATVVMTKGGQKSSVNYSLVDKKKLDQYIKKSLAVSKKSVEAWTSEQRLAYFINLYNSLTVQLILTKYPDLKSIKDLGGFFGLTNSPWKKEFFSLFGKKETLDGIEHGHIRGRKDFNDPRIHFGVNCASIGCPALLGEAFIGERLDQQLETAMVNFLKDRDRNYYKSSENTMYISPIMENWYRSDFEKGHRGFTSLAKTMSLYAEHLSEDSDVVAKIKAQKVEFDSSDYDWNLNDTKKKP